MTQAKLQSILKNEEEYPEIYAAVEHFRKKYGDFPMKKMNITSMFFKTLTQLPKKVTMALMIAIDSGRHGSKIWLTTNMQKK